jgi:hypothetical protein
MSLLDFLRTKVIHTKKAHFKRYSEAPMCPTAISREIQFGLVRQSRLDKMKIPGSRVTGNCQGRILSMVEDYTVSQNTATRESSTSGVSPGISPQVISSLVLPRQQSSTQRRA